MFKTLIISATALFLIGCGPEKNITLKSTMFQSVSKEKALLVQDSSEKKSCSRCGMNLIKFYKTSHSSIFKGTTYQYCSIHCLVDHLSEGIGMEDPKVVDVNSLKFIDIRAAHYVVGSDKRGTMTRVSKYAFSSREDAKKFQAKYGGEIMDFYKALDVAKRDFN